MAYGITGTQYINLTPGITFSQYPSTINIWGYLTATTSLNRQALCVDNYWGAGVGTVESPIMIARGNSARLTTTISAITVPLNEWHMYTVVCTSNTSRTVYYDAGNATTSTVNITANNTMNTIIVGAYWTGVPGNENWRGSLAEAAGWNVALTTVEITSLYKGAKATQVRPASLKFYVPVIRNVQNLTNNDTIVTNTGTSGEAHSRRYG